MLRIYPAVVFSWVHTTHIVIFVFCFLITTHKMYLFKVCLKGMCQCARIHVIASEAINQEINVNK